MNGLLIRGVAVGALAGLLFGFDMAVIAGTTKGIRTAFGLDATGLGITVSSALWGTLVGVAVVLTGVAAVFLINTRQDMLLWRPIAFFAFSQGAVIWIYISEIFPTDMHARGQSLGSSTHRFMDAIIATVFPLEAQHMRGLPFLFFAACIVLQFVVVLLLFLEVKRRSLKSLWRGAVMKRAITLVLFTVAGPAMAASSADPFAPHARNPILPGYAADPSIVHYKGEWFVYATIDPWGGDALGLWRSRNFRDWSFSTPNWPTTAAAHSATSGNAKVWAPSVVRGRDGQFRMYVSVGNEIWVGTSPHPAGPWRDANGGRPLVTRNFRPGFHMIDAEAFIDDDGQAYLYWGSGLNWVNGHCFVVKLKPDMVTFGGEVRDVTPDHYFEGPFMLKRNGKYFLTSSWGNTTKDTYQVRYAVGDTPFGPFREPEDKAILETDAAKQIVSPGHHAIFREGGQDFILYHRQALPFPRGGDEVLRQVAVDRIDVVGDRILPVRPTHEGADVPGTAMHHTAGRDIVLTASSSRDDAHVATRADDDNYATFWQAEIAATSWLQADLGSIRTVGVSELRPARPIQLLNVTVTTSLDGKTWRPLGKAGLSAGSPVALPAIGKARFVRLTFTGTPEILEWTFL